MTRWKSDLGNLPDNIKRQIIDKLFDEKKVNRQPIITDKASKYNNTKTEADGIKFDSLKEMKRYEELKLLERAKEITELTVHPKYILQEPFKKHGIIYRAITYTADFTYIDKENIVRVEDVKAFDKNTEKYILTAEFKLKQKLFEKKYPNLTLKIVGEE